MKKDNKIIYYLSVIGILSCIIFMSGITNAQGYIPDEWIVASSYSVSGGHLEDGTIEDTYSVNGEYLEFHTSSSPRIYAHYYFGSVYAKSIKVKATVSAGLFWYMNLIIHYTTGNPTTHNLPAGTLKTFSLDSSRYIDNIEIEFYVGVFVLNGHLFTDYITILATYPL